MLQPSVTTQFFGKIASWMFYDLSKHYTQIYMRRVKIDDKNLLIVLYGNEDRDLNAIFIEKFNHVTSLCSKSQIFDYLVENISHICELPNFDLSIDNCQHYVLIHGEDEVLWKDNPCYESFVFGDFGNLECLRIKTPLECKAQPMVPTLISAIISMDACKVNLINLHVRGTKLLEMFDRNTKSTQKIHYIDRELKHYTDVPLEDIIDSPRDYGVFLVRNAEGKIEKFHECKSKFLVDNEMSYEDACDLHDNVHEVSYDPDWDLLRWMRSSHSTGALGEHIIYFEGTDLVKNESSIHLIRSSSTCGMSSFLRKKYHKFLEEDCARWIQFLTIDDLERTIQENPLLFEMDPKEIIFKLLSVSSHLEEEVFQHYVHIPGRIMFLMDGMSDLPKQYFPKLGLFLRQLHFKFPSINVWLSARPSLCQNIMNHVPILPYEINPLDKLEVVSLVTKLLPVEAEIHNVEDFVNQIKEQNKTFTSDDGVSCDILENPFSIELCVQSISRHGTKASLYFLNIIDDFIRYKHKIKKDSDLLNIAHTAACHYTLTEPGMSIELPEIQQKYDIKNEKRIIIEYLTAIYFINHPHLLTESIIFEGFTKNTLDFIDKIQFSHSKLGRCILHGDLEALITASDEKPNMIKDSFNRNLLYVVDNGHVSICEYLVEKGVSLNENDKLLGWTPMKYADRKKSYNIIEIMLRNGCDANDLATISTAESQDLGNIFSTCFSCGNYTLCDFIVENLPNFRVTAKIIFEVCLISDNYPRNLVQKVLKLAVKQNLKSSRPWTAHGMTALHMVVEDLHGCEIARILVEELGFYINAEDYSGARPLCHAKAVDMLKYLTELGADPYHCHKHCNNRTLFHTACMEGNLDIVKFYIENLRADVEILNQSPIPPLHYAAQSGNLNLVKYLYANGFNQINQKDQLNGETPLHYACLCRGHLDIAEFLLEHGAEVNKTSNFGKYPIDMIFGDEISSSSRQLFALLIDKGVEIKVQHTFHLLQNSNLDIIKKVFGKFPESFDWNGRYENGETYLHYCAQYVHDENIIKYFVEKCDSEVYDENWGVTPLQMALSMKNKKAFKIFLENGANVAARSKSGSTMMHFAAMGPDKHTFEILFNHGLDINERNSGGESPVHNFALSEDKSLCNYLIEKGMEVDSQDNEGRTALHNICRNPGYFATEQVDFCLKYLHIDSRIVDSRGRTALHYAVEKNNLGIIKIMAKYQILNLQIVDENGETPISLAKIHAYKDILEFFEGLCKIQEKAD